MATDVHLMESSMNVLIEIKVRYLFLYSPAQKGPTESKANPEGHWLLRSPTREKKAEWTGLLEY